MKKIITIFILGLLFCGCACKKEEMAKMEVTNVAVPTSLEKETKPKETVVIDYKDFPLDKNNKEVWVKKVKTGKADIVVINDEELKVDVLNVKSDVSSYYFKKQVNVDIDKYGIVSWKWKVKANPKGGDVRKSATDDQAIQILFAFEGKYIISYIWDATAPAGYSKDSSIPFIVAQKILVLESGNEKLDQWLEIRRDIKADFKKLYKMEAPKLAGIAVQANSQHTKTKCEALLSPITFEAK
jgi:hypothetical protein